MKAFADLYRELDETTKTNRKIEAIVRYLTHASPNDAAWAIYFLAGNKIKRLIPQNVLRRCAVERSGSPDWLFEESYGWVGDLAETISLMVPSTAQETLGSLTEWIEDRIQPLAKMEAESLPSRLANIWSDVGPNERFLMLKLMTGSLRVGVSSGIVVRSVADAFKLPVDVVAHRLTGTWHPTVESFERLISSSTTESVASQPYLFCLANPLDRELQELGSVAEFQVEWKWDGIRAQLIKRNQHVYIWSRGEERVEERYPEITHVGAFLPDNIVLDGELLAWNGAQPLPFADMQRRIGRKTVGKKLLAEIPVIFMAYDLLEWDARDIRSEPLHERRRLLETFLPLDRIPLSPLVVGETWDELASIRRQSRERMAEGLMLKQRSSPYVVGRIRGAWWKWKIEPLAIDAVLMYAQKGHGRRSSLYSDYTFGLWDGDQLVPFAKAYSGLTDDELREVDRFVKANTREKFGPVRSVTPELVMELGFESIQLSKRHKSGIAVRFPRILRWRSDKKPADANSLADLKNLLQSH